MKSRQTNIAVIKKLEEKSVWFFDDFLMQSDYQKIRNGKRAADNVYRSLLDVIRLSKLDLDLIKKYESIKNMKPQSITIV